MQAGMWIDTLGARWLEAVAPTLPRTGSSATAGARIGWSAISSMRRRRDQHQRDQQQGAEAERKAAPMTK